MCAAGEGLTGATGMKGRRRIAIQYLFSVEQPCKKDGKKRSLLLSSTGLFVLSAIDIMNTLNAGLMSGPELVVVFVVILVLFGAKKIPEFAKGLGQGIKEFKKASREVTDEIHSSINEQPSYPAAPPPARTEPAGATPTPPPPAAPKA
jgi:sec-independent protein translocase protein TatA